MEKRRETLLSEMLAKRKHRSLVQDRQGTAGLLVALPLSQGFEANDFER